MTQGEEPSAAALPNASGRQVVRNAAWGYIGLAAGVVMGGVLTPVLLGHLGTTTFGLWSLLVALVSYAGLLDAGVVTALVQQVAARYAEGDEAKLDEIFGTAVAFYLVTGGILVALCGILVPFLGSAFHIAAPSLAASRLAVIFLGVSGAVGFVANVPSAALFGGGRNDRLGIVGLALGLATRLAQIGVVLLGQGLVALALVTVGSGLVGLILNQVIARRTFGRFRMSPRYATRGTLVTLLRSGRRNTAVTLAGVASFGIDKIVIGAILPIAEVTPYAIALQTVTLVRSLSTAGTDILMPTYGHFEALADREHQFRIFSTAVLGSMIVMLPIGVAAIGFGQPLLHLWLGTVPPKTYVVLVMLMIVFALQLPGHQCFVLLTGSGHNRLIARLGLPAALLNIAASVGATYWLGPVGPAVGSLPQVAVLDAIVLPMLVCRHLGVSGRRYVREVLVPLAPLLGVATGAAIALRLATPGDHGGAVTLAEAAAVVAVAWAVTLPIVARRRPDMLRLLRRQ